MAAANIENTAEKIYITGLDNISLLTGLGQIDVKQCDQSRLTTKKKTWSDVAPPGGTLELVPTYSPNS